MFRNLTIGKKISLGFGMVIVFLCGVGVTGYSSTRTATENIDSIVKQLAIAKEINTTLTDAQDAQAASLRYIIYDDEKYFGALSEETANAAQHAENAKGMMLSAENRARADDVIREIDQYLRANQEYRDLQARKGEAGTIRAKAAGDVLDNIKKLLEAQEQAIAHSVRETDDGKVAEYGIVERTLLAQRARNAFNRVRICAQKYQLAVTAEAQDQMAGNWLAEIDATRQVLAECQGAMKDPEALKCVQNCQTALAAYAEQVQTFRELNITQREVQMNKQKPAADALMAGSRNVRDGVYQFIDDVQQRSNASMAFVGTLITSVGIGATILGVLAAVIITRGITRTLTRIIANLNDGADQVNDAAAQVSSASQQSAEGASEQASSLEETSSALEEVAAMTRTNANNAKEANELSGQARDAANNGDKTMATLNGAMSAINDSSGQISKIIKVIEEIAFQTNLLALNAAVEAARAGEHGKGFAVVADEVRNLAQRAAQAARETTGLIEDSVVKVKEGTEVAGDVGKALGAIVSDVTKVTELINGIAQASEEQAQGVDQVNTAVSQMDKVTQQNAAGAEESASAAEELSAQAMTVKGIVDELSSLVGGRSSSNSASFGNVTAAPRTRPGQSYSRQAGGSMSVRTPASTTDGSGASVSDSNLSDF